MEHKLNKTMLRIEYQYTSYIEYDSTHYCKN